MEEPGNREVMTANRASAHPAGPYLTLTLWYRQTAPAGPGDEGEGR